AYTPGSVPETVKVRLEATASSTRFFADTVVTNLLRLHRFTYDSRRRTLSAQLIDPTDAITALRDVNRVYYPSGDGSGLLQKVNQIDGVSDPYTEYTYDSAGRVILTKRGSSFGDCCFTYTVYDAAGNVTLTVNQYVPTDPASDPADWIWDA